MSPHAAACEEATAVHGMVPRPSAPLCRQVSRGWEPSTGRGPQASAISKVRSVARDVPYAPARRA